MNISQQDIPIAMIRDSLEGIPSFPLPASYSIRWYEAGDEAYWLEIQQKSDEFNLIKPELFARQFGTDQRLLAQRLAYLVDGQGQPIGTAAAWLNEAYRGTPYGRIHWVAIVPEFQGRGLAKPLMTVICKRLKSLGHERAYLTTSTVRISAINLYLKFGFSPEINSTEALTTWRELEPYLAQKLDLDSFEEMW